MEDFLHLTHDAPTLTACINKTGFSRQLSKDNLHKSLLPLTAEILGKRSFHIALGGTMSEKERILNAWMMVEHLAEGDINLHDRKNLRFDQLVNHDFHALFRDIMQKEKLERKKNGGIAVFFDIFAFQEVIDFLRKTFHLPQAEEEIPVGNKFSFALCFAKDLSFVKDMAFFTASAFIRYEEEIPQATEFQKFEEDFKDNLDKLFDKTAEIPEKFNAAFQTVLQQYGVSAKNCRMQVMRNMETDVTNLHSFFLDDLSRAKRIKTANLETYLFGNKGARYDLDGKKDSAKFAPKLLADLLQPEKYPLGRYPSNPDYALSLMQQVAVNLATGADASQIRSVNGPPGTGKTTLLKDIFAELIVEQSAMMAELAQPYIRGTEETTYYERASIGVLPEEIIAKSILVASSNNGAVQNIVNELPLAKEIDASFLPALLEADYFHTIANAAVKETWTTDETGKAHRQLTAKPAAEERFWGLFSLEGGRKENMTNLLNRVSLVATYLSSEEFVSDPTIYQKFRTQYQKVKKLRAQVQEASRLAVAGLAAKQELKTLSASYATDLAIQKKNSAASLAAIAKEANRIEQKLAIVEQTQAILAARLSNTNKEKENIWQYLQALGKPPGFFSRLFNCRAAKEYDENRRRKANELETVQKKENALLDQAADLKQEIVILQTKRLQIDDAQQDASSAVAHWQTARAAQHAALERRIQEGAAATAACGKPLDFAQDYDNLQLSNPWFTKNYRIAQTELFIAALRVRKQFLYDNRKNIEAAVYIRKNQSQYLASNRAVTEAAWGWIHLTVPVISSTFASFSRMFRHLGPKTLGHLFIDEAGQALPQASVGAIFRSKHVMVVGDPSQIKPVLTLDASILAMLRKHYGVTERYLSESASTQTLADSASPYGFYKKQDRTESSWIGIPLWVHRRCRYPMFTISNTISYGGFMVQGNKKDGRGGWYDVTGKADDKYVREQGDFLAWKLQQLMQADPRIGDKREKDRVYVISPFRNVACRLARRLKAIGFTRYAANEKPTNVGTIHTFQGREAPIVFMVLGADGQSTGAASWAVAEANMMNVAATRAKEAFYVIGDKSLYLKLGSAVATETYRLLAQFNSAHPELATDTAAEVEAFQQQRDTSSNFHASAPMPAASIPVKKQPPPPQTLQPSLFPSAPPLPKTSSPLPKEPSLTRNVAMQSAKRTSGTIIFVGQGTLAQYAYIKDAQGHEYVIHESAAAKLEHAQEILKTGNRVTFIAVPEKGRKTKALDIQLL